MVGLRLQAKVERELPHGNRYLPMPAAGEGPRVRKANGRSGSTAAVRERPGKRRLLARQRRDSGRHPSGSPQGWSGHTSAPPVHASSKMAVLKAGLLQPPRHLRAVHQRRQGRDQVDPPVVPLLRRQRRPPPAPRAGLQSRQFHADAGDAEDGGAVVANQLVREADQDRSEGRQPRSLRHFPAGRGGGVATDVHRNPVADRPAAGTTHASMRGAGQICDRRQRRRRCALVQANQRQKELADLRNASRSFTRNSCGSTRRANFSTSRCESCEQPAAQGVVPQDGTGTPVTPAPAAEVAQTPAPAPDACEEYNDGFVAFATGANLLNFI
jgi:hypothetical protein